jgi:hypothetical protein
MQPDALAPTGEPVWQFKTGTIVWIRLPMMGRDRSILSLVCAIFAATGILMGLLSNDRHHVIYAVALLAACLQLVLALSSLWALRLQKRRS